MCLFLAPLPSNSLGVGSSQGAAHPDRDLGTLCMYWWWSCYVACVSYVKMTDEKVLLPQIIHWCSVSLSLLS